MATQYGVKAKKGLGQHFLADESIAKRIVDGLVLPEDKSQQLQVLEIGPGTGVLTKYMLADTGSKSLGRSLASIAKLKYKLPFGLCQLFALLPIPSL